MTTKIPVTVLGATGVVGQRFVRRLANHPIFRVEHLAASERSAGKRYRDACAWRLDGEPYGGLGDQVMAEGTPEFALSPVVFSALDSEPALDLEPAFARAGAMVFSNAAAFRMSPEVPLLVPEVNAGHLGLIEVQRHHHGWTGGIVTNANCTATVLGMALAPLHAAFGVEAVLMTSMQAISGAGYPGVASLDILGNVIPFIRQEESKVEEEIPKLLGRFTGSGVEQAPLAVSALCYRVPVIEGHTEAVSVRLNGNPSLDAVREALQNWRPEPQRLGLFSAPAMPVRLHTLEDRPQVRRDVEVDGGMSVHVGRLRPCAILGLKFALLGHNTERGAAGGSILNAELAHAKGYLR
ncbi:MAG: aspartate-semialdehyde dehydrogenase [Geothrix sp.]|nr:aspartate-semialdehyde dehydrogenase [Geothrix sp.]